MTDSTDKKERAMGPKGFLHKATFVNNGKVSANAFLMAHKAWLSTGELAPKTQKVLDSWEIGQTMATPALEQIKGIVLAHHLTEETVKAEAAIDKGARTGKVKAYTATIFDVKGNICTRINDKGEEEDLVKSFDTPQDADRWADRRLFDGAVDWFGVVVNKLCADSEGQNLSQTILRNDAIGRILATKPGAVCKKPPKAGSGRLSQQMKVSQSTCHFSKG